MPARSDGLDPEHRLDERVPGEIPWHAEALDQQLERQLLMGVSADGGVPDPPEELSEGQIP